MTRGCGRRRRSSTEKAHHGMPIGNTGIPMTIFQMENVPYPVFIVCPRDGVSSLVLRPQLHTSKLFLLGVCRVETM